MKTTSNLLLILIFLTSFISFSQNDTKQLSLKNGSIDEQFDYIITKSSRYENYKVIKYSWINQLKAHVNDSISKLKSDLKIATQEINEQKKAFKNLENELQTVNTNLTTTTNAKDTIQFLGISINKGLYKTIMWSLVALLTLALLFFFYKFKNSNEITEKTRADFEELESEYVTSKTRALEREQVLNRRLQDELNKRKK